MEFNNELKASLNIGINSETPTWGDLTPFCKSIAVALNEDIYAPKYLADSGFSSSEVVGMAPTVTFTGDVDKNDPVCRYLSEREYEIGEKRKTQFKLERTGKTIICSVTLTAITFAGGESGATNAITITLAFNGKPEITTVSG